MNADLIAKWNRKVDQQSVKDVKEMEANGTSQDYVEIPCGTYAVEVEKLELVSTKKTGDPMLTIWLKIIEGQHKGRLLFVNQVVDEPFKIHNANNLLRGLLDNTDSNIEVEWTGDYAEYADMIESIYHDISDKYTYDVDYTMNKKGFSQYKFTETYDK